MTTVQERLDKEEAEAQAAAQVGLVSKRALNMAINRRIELITNEIKRINGERDNIRFQTIRNAFYKLTKGQKSQDKIAHLKLSKDALEKFQKQELRMTAEGERLTPTLLAQFAGLMSHSNFLLAVKRNPTIDTGLTYASSLAIGAGAGFLIGGPIGAAIGAAVNWVLAFLLQRSPLGRRLLPWTESRSAIAARQESPDDIMNTLIEKGKINNLINTEAFAQIKNVAPRTLSGRVFNTVAFYQGKNQQPAGDKKEEQGLVYGDESVVATGREKKADAVDAAAVSAEGAVAASLLAPSADDLSKEEREKEVLFRSVTGRFSFLARHQAERTGVAIASQSDFETHVGSTVSLKSAGKA